MVPLRRRPMWSWEMGQPDELHRSIRRLRPTSARHDTTSYRRQKKTHKMSSLCARTTQRLSINGLEPKWRRNSEFSRHVLVPTRMCWWDDTKRQVPLCWQGVCICVDMERKKASCGCRQLAVVVVVVFWLDSVFVGTRACV